MYIYRNIKLTKIYQDNSCRMRKLSYSQKSFSATQQDIYTYTDIDVFIWIGRYIKFTVIHIYIY